MVEETRRPGRWGRTARWVATGLLVAGAGVSGRADEPGPLKAILVEVPGGPPIIKYVPVAPPVAAQPPATGGPPVVAPAKPTVVVSHPPPPAAGPSVVMPGPEAPVAPAGPLMRVAPTPSAAVVSPDPVAPAMPAGIAPQPTTSDAATSPAPSVVASPTPTPPAVVTQAPTSPATPSAVVQPSPTISTAPTAPALVVEPTAPTAPAEVGQPQAPATIAQPSPGPLVSTPMPLPPTVTSQAAHQSPPPVSSPEPTSAPDLVPAPPSSMGPIEAAFAKPASPGHETCATCGSGGGFLDRHFPCAKTPATVVPPLGSSLRSVFDMQRANALAEYFVVYREDWLDGTTSFNPSGMRHLGGIIRRLGMVAAPIRVEPSGDPALDHQRRVAVVESLVRSGVPVGDPAARVIIGGTRAEGLQYQDIEILYSRNASSLSGGFGGGGFGGGGFGGGGFGGGGFGR